MSEGNLYKGEQPLSMSERQLKRSYKDYFLQCLLSIAYASGKHITGFIAGKQQRLNN